MNTPENGMAAIIKIVAREEPYQKEQARMNKGKQKSRERRMQKRMKKQKMAEGNLLQEMKGFE